jgi:coenzyme F420-reducing hydrogenase delta subunit
MERLKALDFGFHHEEPKKKEYTAEEKELMAASKERTTQLNFTPQTETEKKADEVKKSNNVSIEDLAKLHSEIQETVNRLKNLDFKIDETAHLGPHENVIYSKEDQAMIDETAERVSKLDFKPEVAGTSKEEKLDKIFLSIEEVAKLHSEVQETVNRLKKLDFKIHETSHLQPDEHVYSKEEQELVNASQERVKDLVFEYSANEDTVEDKPAAERWRLIVRRMITKDELYGLHSSVQETASILKNLDFKVTHTD